MQTRITTERLTLRPFAESDAGRLAYLAGDYEVAKMCGRVPHPYSLAAAYSWIATHQKGREENEDFPFAVTAPIDGLIGSCGVSRAGEAKDGAWELGYWLGAPYWGMGYALEAGRAVMDWARDVLGAKVFLAGHFADNPASGRVLRKLGFAHAGPSELYGLARQRTSPVERYVWPEDAAPDTLSGYTPHGLSKPDDRA